MYSVRNTLKREVNSKLRLVTAASKGDVHALLVISLESIVLLLLFSAVIGSSLLAYISVSSFLLLWVQFTFGFLMYSAAKEKVAKETNIEKLSKETRGEKVVHLYNRSIVDKKRELVKRIAKVSH
jgi:hypothetical protein